MRTHRGAISSPDESARMRGQDKDWRRLFLFLTFTVGRPHTKHYRFSGKNKIKKYEKVEQSFSPPWLSEERGCIHTPVAGLP